MKTPIHLARLVPCLLLCLLAPIAQSSAETLLERPAGLEPAVEFWKRVYSEVGTNGGLIHDSEYLDVVYSVLRFPEGLSRRSREHRVEKEKRRIRGILGSLARGQHTGLSAAEAEVLSRWPRGVSNDTLRKAASRLRFQLGQANKFRAGLVRSGAWLDHIEQTLRHHGVPVELSALPHVESSFNPHAYSRVGAAGLWQFTRSTGRLFLRIDSVVDERLDPFVATDAAARLLKRNYEITGSWPLAITAYNHGAAGMKRAAQKLGTKNMATIARKYKSRTFGFASRNFYASFLAALDVSRDADRIFGELGRDEPVDYTLISMPHFYRASTLSQALGVSLATLREHNGGLRPAVWEGSKYIPRDYTLRVPRSQIAERPSLLLARIPEHERLSQQHRDRYYKVRRGDTLSRIASRHGVRMSELVALNHLRSRHRIRVGQVLVLPGGAAPPPSVARMDAPADGVYRVRRGDTISIIAKRFGVTERALVAENGLRNRHHIAVGQRLRIPGAAPRVLASAEPVPLSTPQPEPEPLPEPSRSAPPQQGAEVAPTEPAVAPEPEPEPVVVPEPEPIVAQEPEPDPEPEREPEPQVVELAPEPEPDEAIETASEPEGEGEPEPVQVVPATAPGDDDEDGPPAKIAVAKQPTHAPDPSDYSVHADGRVTVQAEETIGHYADWLEIRASELRRRNGMRYEQPLVIGRLIRLDFRKIDPEEFERRRLEFHRTLQDEFFSAYEVTGTQTHVLRSGETLWYLAERKYQVPLWLLRQYNPDLDFSALPAGVSMVVPQIEPRGDA
jgi:membrane-bound lytic murein transglycosylase D